MCRNILIVVGFLAVILVTGCNRQAKSTAQPVRATAAQLALVKDGTTMISSVSNKSITKSSKWKRGRCSPISLVVLRKAPSGRQYSKQGGQGTLSLSLLMKSFLDVHFLCWCSPGLCPVHLPLL